MTTDAYRKVTSSHLKRNAYLYIRQSTLRQVFENTESTQRQYALRQQAVALGWPLESVIVIDTDLGQSGASAADREGFQRLVAEVGMGKAGIVLGLEVSRLARNNTDWHRLLEICALSDTLILDEDGIYDPSHFNDRLLLGLKGTMSEAELHVLRTRLYGGLLSKARRGELRVPLPTGFVYDSEDRPILDPDQQVRQSLEVFFETFRRTGSATATVKAFHRQELRFPRRARTGPHKGELLWGKLSYTRALDILHNPRYAGAFVFGRTRFRKTADGREVCYQVPQDQWVLIPEVHPGYISWQDYEDNEKLIRENSQAQGEDRMPSPPREGPALLQGLALCGVCGRRMTVGYHSRYGLRIPNYRCQKETVERGGGRFCQSINGEQVDETIGRLLVETVTPLALEVTLAVQQELEERLAEVDRLRSKQVERARYEADLAKRRFLLVDPEHRLVADALEAEWNSKLRTLHQTLEEHERLRQADRIGMDQTQRARISALASDFPRLWADPRTPDREKKRMVRLLLEDVTLVKKDRLLMHIRFKGGVTQSVSLPLPLGAIELHKTDPAIVREIDSLLDEHTEGEISAVLNEKGLRSGTGRAFTPMMVLKLRRKHRLKHRFQRLRETGLLTMQEVGRRLGVTIETVKKWRRLGLLRARPYNDKGQYLYEPPGENWPAKGHRKPSYQLGLGVEGSSICRRGAV
jgi:DNA invertase Pin-like site-specific DNA recombinase